MCHQERGQTRDKPVGGQHQEHIAGQGGRQGRHQQPAQCCRRATRQLAPHHQHDRQQHRQWLEQLVPRPQLQSAGCGGQRGRLQQQCSNDRQPALQHRTHGPVERDQGRAANRGPGRTPAAGKPQNQRNTGEQQQELRPREPLAGAVQRRVEGVDLAQVEVGFGPAQRHVGRTPAGRLEPDPHLVAPALRAPTVLQQRPIDLRIGPQRVPAAQGSAGAVHTLLLLLAKAAEQPVPDDQDAAVVLVQITVVDRVVHAVVARRTKNAVEPAEFSHQFGVHPELVEQVDQCDDCEHQRRNPGQRHRQVEDPSKQGTAAGLAQRGGQVVVLALVVHHMGGPEQRHLVARAVVPVITKIVENQRQQNAVPGAPKRALGPYRQRMEDQGVDADHQHLGEQAAELAQHAQTDAADRVVQAVDAPAARDTQRILRSDHQKEHRRGQHDDLAAGHMAPVRPVRWHGPGLVAARTALPPKGALAPWGGPAALSAPVRPVLWHGPGLVAARTARGLAGRGSRDASPLSPVHACSSRHGAAGSSPEGALAPWGGPAARSGPAPVVFTWWPRPAIRRRGGRCRPNRPRSNPAASRAAG